MPPSARTPVCADLNRLQWWLTVPRAAVARHSWSAIGAAAACVALTRQRARLQPLLARAAPATLRAASERTRRSPISSASRPTRAAICLWWTVAAAVEVAAPMGLVAVAVPVLTVRRRADECATASCRARCRARPAACAAQPCRVLHRVRRARFAARPASAPSQAQDQAGAQSRVWA